MRREAEVSRIIYWKCRAQGPVSREGAKGAKGKLTWGSFASFVAFARPSGRRNCRFLPTCAQTGFSAPSGFRPRKRDFARAEPGNVRANRKIAAQSEFCPRKTDFIRAKMPAPRAEWIFAAQSGKASWLAAERQRSGHSGHKRNVHRQVGGEFFQFRLQPGNSAGFGQLPARAGREQGFAGHRRADEFAGKFPGVHGGASVAVAIALWDGAAPDEVAAAPREGH
jgi:hypothetical protein